MSIENIAKLLDGCQYGDEGNKQLFIDMKNAGLVAVFGASDDLMEFRGAIYDEVGVYDGGTAYITPEGLLKRRCEDADCPHEVDLQDRCQAIDALWCPDDECSWKYETDIPHATFKVMEGNDLYCVGIVFALADVKAA